MVTFTREQYLDLFASYLPEGDQFVARIVDHLELTRRGGFRAPEKILIILFASRAGSNYLGQLLSSTGWFREIGESFRPTQLTKIRDRYGLADHYEAAQWMIDNRGTPHAFGFKAGFNVLTSAAELGFLSEAAERAQFVLLRRHDRVAQAVSLVKGKLSGQMHSGQPVQRALTDADYDFEAIAFQGAIIAAREAQFADLTDRLGKSAPILYYEDILSRPEEHVRRLCELMELPMPASYEPNLRLSVLRDDLSARWAERFRTQRGQEFQA